LNSGRLEAKRQQMINKLDRWLMQHPPRPDLRGARRFCVEFWFFG
jgi:hypothetical protein